MATRSGASVGTMVSLTIFALLALAMFVTTVIFAARSQRLAGDLETANNSLAQAVRPEDRNDRWEELKRAAGNAGVVGYLDDENRALVRLAGGTRRDDSESLRATLTDRFGESATSLLAVAADLGQRIEQLEDELASAQRARDAAQADLSVTVERLAQTEAQHRDTIAALTEEVDRYRGEVESYRDGVEESRDRYSDDLADLRAAHASELAEVEATNRELQDRALILQDLLDRARGEMGDVSIGADNEATLYDATVLAINPVAREISIDRGRRDNVVLGLTFEVYNIGTSLRPDAEGNFPTGKASVEITRIDESTSRARVVRQTRGNPIIEGDLLVNPLYDPDKTYVFTIFGNFDTNGDGVATPQEAGEIRALIESWGGRAEDDISGMTDFVVLGERPVLPPEPKFDDPTEVILRYLGLKERADRYDALFEDARQTGIPVLNQNRFYTLTGLHGQP